MSQALSDKSARIVVVETNSSARSILSDVVRELGFKDVQQMDSVKAAMGYLEVEHADWVITPILTEEQINGLHLLGIFSKHDQFQKTHLSLLLEGHEKTCLPRAFEGGLLSYHHRPFTKDSLKHDLDGLLQRIEKHAGDDVLVAADYLSSYLKESTQTKSYLSLYGKLLEAYPEVPEVLLCLAEAHFMNGNIDQGRIALGRAKLLKITGWEEIADQYAVDFNEVKPDLGVKKCIIVDPDESVCKKVGEILGNNSAAAYHPFADGEAALEFCQKNPDVDLVLQEWKIPGVTGPNLLQRVRSTMRATLPIVVVSSLVGKQDLVLLNEMGVANVIEKPIGDKKFLNAIVQTLQQEHAPTTRESLERKISQNLALGQKETALRFWDKIQTDATLTTGQKMFIEGLFLFYDGKYNEVKDTLFEALKHGADPVKGFNLLGRSLAKLKDYDGACKCFQKAQELSPKNVERLCEIATCESELSKHQDAKKSVDKAKVIDAKNKVTQTTELKVALNGGDKAEAKALLAESKFQGELVAEMNNTAVAYVRSGAFEKGRTLYLSTLEALDPKQAELRGRVSYNLALAYVRNNQLDEALVSLREIRVPATAPIVKKVKSLKEKIETAKKTGKSVELASAQKLALELAHGDAGEVAKMQAEHSEIAELAMQLGVKHSEETHRNSMRRGCFPIFKAVEQGDPKWDAYFKSSPKFTARSAIARADAMGVERLLK